MIRGFCRSSRILGRGYSHTQCDILKVKDCGEGVFVLQMTNEEKRNPLSMELLGRFEVAIDELSREEALRAVVVTGEGQSFCAGGDYDFLEERLQSTSAQNRAALAKFYDRILRMFRGQLLVPLIMAVNGSAVGGGAALSLLGDVRLASADAHFCFNFVSMGIHPGMGSSYLARFIAGSRGQQWLLTGENVDAVSALDASLVSEVVQGDVAERAVQMGLQIAKNSPEVTRMLVRTLRRRVDVQIQADLENEIAAQAASFSGTDLREGLSAARLHRKPDFLKASKVKK